MPVVRIIAGPGTGQRYDLSTARSTIGRDAANQIQIADPKSSRVHAEVVTDKGRFLLRDLDSSNGTWNDDGRISSTPLVHGAEFRIGATCFRFESMPEGSATWSDPATIAGLDRQPTALFTKVGTADVAALNRANAYLVLLHHLILRSHAASDREALFELLDDAAAETLEGDRCAVFLPGGIDGWTLWPAHERRLRARFGVVPFARSLLSAVRQRGEPLLCTSDGDLLPSMSMVQAGVQSAMAAPVRLGEQVHALLYVDRLAAERPFTRTDLEFLAAVANQMAARLANRATVDALQAEVRRLQQAPVPVVEFIGDDPQLSALRLQAERLAAVDLPVLITGEAGTGKELLARFIHAHSARAGRPFQVITCVGLDDDAAEALLFGRAKAGAGALELADGGTLYLDDLAALPVSVQARLKRVMESGDLQRAGDAATRHVNVRLIAANVGIQAASNGLLDALAGQRLEIPPLRQRAGDIVTLAEYMLAQHATRSQQPSKRLGSETKAALLRYGWPGNVRELRHVIERAIAFADTAVIAPSDLPEHVRAGGDARSEAAIPPLAVVEKAHILRVLEHCGGNKKAAAELLEIDRSTLYAKLKQYGVA